MSRVQAADEPTWTFASWQIPSTTFSDNTRRLSRWPSWAARSTGPGEAKDADVGIAAGVGRAIIFRKGQKARIVAEDDMLTALMEEVGKAEAEIL